MLVTGFGIKSCHKVCRFVMFSLHFIQRYVDTMVKQPTVQLPLFSTFFSGVECTIHDENNEKYCHVNTVLLLLFLCCLFGVIV